MSQTAGTVLAFVVALVLLVPNLWLTWKPDEVARINDTRGPAWVRNFSLHGPDPARPGRTKPRLMWRTGVMLLAMAATFLALGVAGCLGVDLT